MTLSGTLESSNSWEEFLDKDDGLTISMYYKDHFPAKEVLIFANDGFQEYPNYFLGVRDDFTRQFIEELVSEGVYKVPYPIVDCKGGEREICAVIVKEGNASFWRYQAIRFSSGIPLAYR